MTATAQATAALAKGNARRLARAKFKREVADLSYLEGKALVGSVLDSPPPELERMRVHDLLCCVYRCGPMVAASWCAFAGVGATTEVGGLTVRQVRALREQMDVES